MCIPWKWVSIVLLMYTSSSKQNGACMTYESNEIPRRPSLYRFQCLASLFSLSQIVLYQTNVNLLTLSCNSDVCNDYNRIWNQLFLFIPWKLVKRVHIDCSLCFLRLPINKYSLTDCSKYPLSLYSGRFDKPFRDVTYVI